MASMKVPVVLTSSLGSLSTDSPGSSVVTSAGHFSGMESGAPVERESPEENAHEEGPPSARGPTLLRSLGAAHLRNLRKSRVRRHLEEALEEGASAAVLRNALGAAKQLRWSTELTDSAAATLCQVEAVEAGLVPADPGYPLVVQVQEQAGAGAAPASPPSTEGPASSRSSPRSTEGDRTPRSLQNTPRSTPRSLATTEGLTPRLTPRTEGTMSPRSTVGPTSPRTPELGMRRINVPKVPIDPAKRREAQRAVATKKLEAATDLPTLKKAVYAAREVGVRLDVLRPYEVQMEGAATIQTSLERALAAQDVSGIRRCVESRFRAWLDWDQLARAEAVLAEEEGRRRLFSQLSEARQNLALAAVSSPRTKSVAFEAASNDLKQLIMEGRRLGVPDRQLAVFEDGLETDTQRLMARHTLWNVMMEANGVSLKTSDMETLVRTKQQLQDAVAEARVAGLPEIEIMALDKDRRRVHNAIEDRRGAVRVYCRVRPLSGDEANAGETEAVRCSDGFNVEVEQDPSLHRASEETGSFSFDSCWAPGTQEEVFDSMRDLVQSAIDGYNVTVFAYGQTGAGKTHTMYGPKEPVLGTPKVLARRVSSPAVARGRRPAATDDECHPGGDDRRGICQRTTDEVFRIIGRDRGRISFTVTFSMMELYCQRFIDLLDPNSDRPIKIRTLPTGEVYLENLQEKVVHGPHDVEPLVQAGLAYRHVRSTRSNPESSRSHVLFLMKITAVNRETGQTAKGKISLVDLAGSERVKRSDVRGEGLKEAIEVNRSLTALADVVAALARGEKHVPYRNHELTQVMLDSLGGDAKSLMLVNLSPLTSHSEETLCSCRFAQRVKGATTRHPVKPAPVN